MKILACLSLAALLLFTSARARNAVYVDSDFELNAPGYLYNIGKKKYLGIVKPVSDPMRIGVVDKEESIIPIRVYLNQPSDKGGFVLFYDNPMDKNPVPTANVSPSNQNAHEKMAVQVCKKDEKSAIILSQYNSMSGFNFFFTPPMLAAEKAFQVISGDKCLGFDDQDTLSLISCTDYPEDVRNKQMFAWVSVDSFNRGHSPVNYKPDPYTHYPSTSVKRFIRRTCPKYTGSAGSFLPGSPARDPTSHPYYAEASYTELPSYCSPSIY